MDGGLFAAGMLAVIGLPPFGMFVSEFALVRAGFAVGRPVVIGLVLALLAIGFVAVIAQLNRMLYGRCRPACRVGEGSRWALLPLAGCAVGAGGPRAHGAAAGGRAARRASRRSSAR